MSDKKSQAYLNQSKTDRPPYKVCKICGRKRVSPEMRLGKWVMPPKKNTCYNCTSFDFESFNDIIANKRIVIKSKKEADTVYPLRVVDMTRGTLIGIYTDPKTLRRSLNFYRVENEKSKIKIVDKKWHDFTQYFGIK